MALAPISLGFMTEEEPGEIIYGSSDEDEDEIEDNRVKMKLGTAVSVYDGRKWPVTHCGNVIVSPEEKVSDVKASIVSGNISKDKRKKSSKYALAISSSFGHVHAFLQDEDYVLDKIEKTTAEEKCLMLIKKPKSSSKKMFKSQSWANLSLSDSHLYNQPNYNTEGRKHRFRMKRKPSDLQTVPCESMTNLTDYGLRVDSYIPQQREIKSREQRNFQRFNGVSSPQSTHSENLSNRNKTLNEDMEINNNKLSKQTGSRLYSSHMDIYRNAPKLSYIQENTEKCVLRSDEMYANDSATKGHIEEPNSVSRAHSVGNLSTGLTLSVVGQRKADSVQSLSVTQNSTFKPVSEESGKAKKFVGKLFSPTNTKKAESAKKCVQNKNDLQNTLRDLLTNISEKEKESEKCVKNGSSEKRDSSTPVKPKRSLPNVPAGQVNDRKKHYTDMVRQRVSQHSRSGGQSSSSGTSSSVRTVLETPLDKEVSDLFGPERESCPGMLENAKGFKNGSNNSHHGNYNSHQDSLNVSIPSSHRSCDSGQATITSLSSTVDSGYLTNDAENDMYSSSSYMKSLQRSAQNLYSKKAPLSHSQSMYQESPRKLTNTTSMPKESAISKGQANLNSSKNLGGTYPRSGQGQISQGQGQTRDVCDNGYSQENQKPKPQNCDKLMKYSSMKNLSTSNLPEGQMSNRSQPSNKNIQNFKETLPNDLSKPVQFSDTLNKRDSYVKQNDLKKLETSLPLTSNTEVKGQPPAIESHYNTLPGNWKFQKKDNEDNSTKLIPSLFQLSQTHKFIAITLTVGLEFNVLDHLHLCEKCIKLQNTKKSNKRESTAMSPPQGKYARLGGPGSAFTPVKVSNSNSSLYSVVTIEEMSAVFIHKNIRKGDVIIEVNNKMVLGEPIASIQSLISSSTDDILLMIARPTEYTASCTQTTNENSPLIDISTNENSRLNKSVPVQNGENKTNHLVDSQVDHLKKQVARLTLELKRKTKAIRELNSLLPWRPNEDQSEINGNNEIALNGLSEDEFIV